MSSPVVVHIGRTTVVTASLGYDVSQDVLTSQIRAEKDRDSLLIGTFAVEFLTDGTDGELILTFDDADSVLITERKGFMDIQRVTFGEPISALPNPLRVVFRKTVTK